MYSISEQVCLTLYVSDVQYLRLLNNPRVEAVMLAFSVVKYHGNEKLFHYTYLYTRKNTRSVTAFNSTDIRAKQGNVATPVLNSYDGHMQSVSVLISGLLQG